MISYRREDSGVITGRIFDRLVARYGRDAIFRDIDDIPIGVDFRTHVDQVLAASDVVLAVVGPQWLGPPASESRLGNEADPVRVEIEAALRKGAPLIPVLVLGAAMPMASLLPESLKDFAFRNGVQLDAGQDFDVHMGRLLRAMDRILGLPAGAAPASVSQAAARLAQPAPPKYRRLLIGGPIAAVLAIAVAGGWYFGWDRQKSPAPADTGMVSTNVAPPPVLPIATPPASPPAAPSIDPELLFWQTIANSSAPADFEEYLRRYPEGPFAGLARNRLAVLRVPPAPPAAEPAPPPVAAAPPAASEGEANWTIEEKREVQRALRALGHYQGEPDGGFGPGTRAAIRQFREFGGIAETGDLTEAERKNLLDMAQRLAVLLDQPAGSPRGVAAASVKGGAPRYAQAWNFETAKGVKADPAEAAYWYALAAADGEAKALTNLGTLVARGWGSTKPDPVAAGLLWWVAAALARRSRCSTRAYFTSAALASPPIWGERGPGTSAPPRTTIPVPATR